MSRISREKTFGLFVLGAVLAVATVVYFRAPRSWNELLAEPASGAKVRGELAAGPFFIRVETPWSVQENRIVTPHGGQVTLDAFSRGLPPSKQIFLKSFASGLPRNPFVRVYWQAQGQNWQALTVGDAYGYVMEYPIS